jgi:hypothetical protein
MSAPSTRPRPITSGRFARLGWSGVTGWVITSASFTFRPALR